MLGGGLSEREDLRGEVIGVGVRERVLIGSTKGTRLFLRIGADGGVGKRTAVRRLILSTMP